MKTRQGKRSKMQGSKMEVRKEEGSRRKEGRESEDIVKILGKVIKELIKEENGRNRGNKEDNGRKGKRVEDGRIKRREWEEEEQEEGGRE